MDEQRKNRLAAAITVNAIILVVILVAVIIYQLVEITAVNNKRNEIITEIEQYEQKLETSQDELEYVQTSQYLLDLAFQLGYRFPKD